MAPNDRKSPSRYWEEHALHQIHNAQIEMIKQLEGPLRGFAPLSVSDPSFSGLFDK